MAGRSDDHPDYRDCWRKDPDCPRFPCRVYREGRQSGWDDGYCRGLMDGEAAGFSAGFAAGMAAASGNGG